MFTILRGGHLYTPADAGVQNVICHGERIVALGRGLRAPELSVPVEEIDCRGKLVAPGFIDQHLHILGGGGGEGPASRIPELRLSDIVEHGVTTVAGILGLDPVTKPLAALYTKAKALEMDGLTTFIYNGSFEFPPHTLTGSMRSDLLLVDKVIGVKVTLADARGGHPDADQLARLLSDVYTGGSLGGKAGVVHAHLGHAGDPYPLMAQALARSHVPPEHLVVTHVNYSEPLLRGAIEFARHGTYLNVDSILDPELLVPGAVPPDVAIKRLLAGGVPLERLTMCTDGNGSVPRVDPRTGARLQYHHGMDTILRAMRCMTQRQGLPLPDALSLMTRNAARALALSGRKGSLAPGMDADVLVLDPDLRVDSVLSRGRVMVREGRAVVRGMCEEPAAWVEG